MIDTVQPAKSGSKVHIFLTRNPRDDSPVTLCGRDIVTNPTISPNPARVGTSKHIYDNFCKTCVKHFESSAGYRAKVDNVMAAIAKDKAAIESEGESDWLGLDFTITRADIDEGGASVTPSFDFRSNLARLLFTGRERHGMIKHQHDLRRREMKLKARV